MSSASDSLDALLASAGEEDFSYNGTSENEVSSLEERQALLCKRLIQSLEKDTAEHVKAISDRRLSLESSVLEGEKDGSQPEALPSKFIHTSMEYNNKSKASAALSGTARRLSSNSAAEASLDPITIRKTFADSSASMSNLPPLLASLMVHRVDTEKVLPATQDAQANEDAMNSISALTLTKPALIAAELYSKLLSIPGAYGSGLIEMEAVSALSALFRRWRIECIAAMDLLLCHSSQANKNKKTKVKKTGKRKSSKKSKDSNPTKRGRRNPKRAVNFDVSSSDEETNYTTDDTGNESEGASISKQLDKDNGTDEGEDDTISPQDLVMLGLKAAQAVCKVCLQREFMSWSSESREAIIDAVTSLYGTTCALVTPSLESKVERDLVERRTIVVGRAAICLKQCILRGKGGLHSGNNDDDNEEDEDDQGQGKTSVSLKRHETSVFIFRGLFPIMSMREALPNGEAGKQLACELVAETVQGFVKDVAEDMADKNSFWTPASIPQSTTRKAAREKRASISMDRSIDSITTPKSKPKKGRKKRVSFGGVDSKRTPLVKSGKNSNTLQPESAGSTPGQSLAYEGTRPRPVLSAVLGLLEKLATAKGLERAYFRGSIVKSLHTCLRYLPSLERTYFLRFLNQLCQSKVSIHRLVGAELLGSILSEEWLWENHIGQPSTTPGSQPYPQSALKTPLRIATSKKPGSHAEPALNLVDEKEVVDIPSSLLESLIGRLTDKAPAVRARAASSFAELLAKVSLATPKEDQENGVLFISELRKCLASHGYSLVQTMRKRALLDEKATVRRTAIGALVEILLLGHFNKDFHFNIGEEEITAFGSLCRDNSMLTRKAAAQALTTMLEKCCLADRECHGYILNLLERTWASSVLPLALDLETSCVTKAVEMFHHVVILPLTLDERNLSFNRRSYLTAWRILASICEGCGTGGGRDETEALKVALTKLATLEAVPQEALKSVLTKICDVAVQTLDGSVEELCKPDIEAQRTGVWCLFDALVDHTKDLAGLYRTLKRMKIDLGFLGTSWENMLKLLENPALPSKSASLLRACMRSCLRLLSKLASCVQIDVAKQTSRNLYSMLQGFILPADLIGSAVSALMATSVVCYGHSDVGVVHSDCKEKIEGLYDACEQKVTVFVKQACHGDAPMSEEGVVRALFTVGELAVVGFSPDVDDDKKRGHREEKEIVPKSDLLRGFSVQPSSRLVDLVLNFLPRHIVGIHSAQTPETARAHGFIAVGKLCLRDEKLAKKCLTILARELHENLKDGCPKVQSNALLVLGDLCIRYTSMVDRYLPVMAACLQSGHAFDDSILSEDKSSVVRKHAILLLSNLLLQDYIKWRGLLFHRFLVASADNDETVASIGESILVGPLLARNPKLFFNNFVESLFVLNRCTAHPIYIAAAATGDVGAGIAVGFEGINLSGHAGKEKRFRMYDLLLSKMSDEEKIGITARLAKEVLGSALNRGSDLHRVCMNPIFNSEGLMASDTASHSAFNVLTDCLAVLSSPALRVGKLSQALEEENDLEDPNVPNASRHVITAKGKLLSRISRKHLIEIVFPILCNLKQMLQSSCSPLLKDLMAYMVHIFRTYKTEVKDFLSNDPSLLQEIEYDAKNLIRKTPVKKQESNGSAKASTERIPEGE